MIGWICGHLASFGILSLVGAILLLTGLFCHLATKQRWDDAHINSSSGGGGNGSTYTRLYTDENPATTIKGLGFKNKRIAQRTIQLTSQPGARYKQYFTIRAMRERVACHPHITQGMVEAMAVFDDWLQCYTEPSPHQLQEQKAEWDMFHKLCASDANKHSYGDNPTKDELRRAQHDLSNGQRLLIELIKSRNKHHLHDKEESELPFPLTSFVALFGGPGLHGYGKHTINIDDSRSEIHITSLDGLSELVGQSKTIKLALVDPLQIYIQYDRQKECCTSVAVEQTSMPTLTSLWSKNSLVSTTKKLDTAVCDSKGERDRKRNADCLNDSEDSTSWTCASCTFIHDKSKQFYLSCEVCGSQRVSNGALNDASSNNRINKNK